MRKHAAIVFCSFIVLCLIPAFAGAQFNRGNDRVCVYRDNNFNGREQCYNPGDEISDLRGAQISSIRVSGRARAIIYDDRNFRGNTSEFSNDVSDLARVAISGSGRAWNDRVASLRVTSDNGRYDSDRDRRPGTYGYPSDARNIQEGVCIYDRPNYEGRAQCWASTMDVPDLGRLDWSDRIQSIRIFGRARVTAFRDTQYRGERVVINRDIPDLAQVGMRAAGSWNRQISSLQVNGNQGNGRRNRDYRYRY